VFVSCGTTSERSRRLIALDAAIEARGYDAVAAMQERNTMKMKNEP
jgi:hypothetical protein